VWASPARRVTREVGAKVVAESRVKEELPAALIRVTPLFALKKVELIKQTEKYHYRRKGIGYNNYKNK
jgi:hypothetical protein